MGRAARHILPFFIPMQGCAYRCVYCDQHSISGQADLPTPRRIEEEALAYKGSAPAQLAFYGGSFTALSFDTQEAYLRAARPALHSGRIDSIRISTRPDALSAAGLQLLSSYKVSTVELGIQSFDAAVLQAAGRAYSPSAAIEACRQLRAAGFELGLQLMTGLPRDTREKSLRSMAQGCALRADFFRIYPTVVLQNTPLARLYEEGQYQPQSLAEAAALAAAMLAIALRRNRPVIRIGLNPSPSVERALLAGPYHPAFGQLAYGALKLQQAMMLLEKTGQEALTLAYPPRERPLLFGQKNEQWRELQARFPGLTAQAAPDLAPGALRAHLAGGAELTLEQTDFLEAYTERLPAR
jgi:histone acetyltransferase (RNA polymerase elongator complex component)